NSSRIVHADVCDVITVYGFPVWVPTSAGEKRPTEVRRIVVPHDRNDIRVSSPEFGGECGYLRKLIGWSARDQFFIVNERNSLEREGVSPDLVVVCHRLPGERNKILFEVVADLQRPQKSGVGPFANPIVGPQNDIRAFAALSCGLEFVCEIVWRLYPDRNPKILLKFVSEFDKSVVALVSINPNEQLTIGPGKRPSGGPKDEDPEKKISGHTKFERRGGKNLPSPVEARGDKFTTQTREGKLKEPFALDAK